MFIENVPVPLYQPLDPYVHTEDNLPIIALTTRTDLLDGQISVLTDLMNNSIGTQGTLGNRLNQSLNPDGTLKTVAIDNALHSIAEHIDGGGFVRMTLDERNKLSFIAPDATSLAINFNTISGIRSFINDIVTIQPSDSITWRYSGSNIFADTNFPSSVRHNHYYNLIPVPANLITPDHKNYKTTSLATAYMQGSLRVYINGIKLTTFTPTYVPTGMPGIITYSALYYTEGTASGGIVTGGDFSLSTAIPSSAVITIDFDVLFS